MRILVVGAEWFPDRTSGYGRVVTRTTQVLAGRGHEIDAVVPACGGLPSVEAQGSLRVLRVLPRGPLPRTIVDPLAVWRAVRSLDRRYDVVVSHLDPHTAGVRLAGIDAPLVFVYHASLPRELRYDRAFENGAARLRSLAVDRPLTLLERHAIRRADRVIVLSEYSRSLLCHDHPSAAAKVVRIPGGVDTDLFSPGDGQAAARTRLGVQPEASLLVTARRLEPRMGLEVLLGAMAQLGGRPVELVIMGEGSLAEALRARACVLGVAGQVRFTGFVPDERLREWYRAADAFVLPTLAYEGFGMATLEALACGTPVLGTPVGATPELLRPLDPRLLAGGTSSADLALGIDRVLALSGPELRGRCRAFAQTLDWEEVGADWDAALLQVVRETGGGHSRGGARPRATARPGRPPGAGGRAAPGGAVATGASETVGIVAALPPQVGGVPSFAGWLLGQEDALGCTFVPFDLWRPAHGPGGGKLNLTAVALQVRNGLRFLPWVARAPRVVHYCVAGNPTGLARDLVFVQWLHARGRRVIAHLHSGTDIERVSSSRLYRWALRRLARATHLIVAISPSAAGLLEGQGIDATTVLNPLRLEPGATLPRADDATLRLLFVGSYGRDKGCPELLAALAEARARGAHATLTFLGKEKHRGEEAMLRAAADRLEVDDLVTFAGVRGTSGVRRAYLEHDVLCLPSYAEGLPMVVLEAMALGLPVVATRVGAVPDIVVDGESGLLVEPGDVSGLAAAISRLDGDPSLVAELGANARRGVVGRAAGEAVVAEWRAIYARVRDGASRSEGARA